MNFKNINIIRDHLVVATISHFLSLEKFWGQDTLSQYQEILELVAFFFEDYRQEFVRLMKSNYELNGADQDMEIIVFISWCSQHAFQGFKSYKKQSSLIELMAR